MRRPSLLEDVPDPDAIRDALKSICPAPRGWRILNSHLLSGLACAQKHMPSRESDADDFSDAVRKYLNEAIKRVAENQNRVILEVVLGLGAKQWQDKEWRQRPAWVRRDKAGELFRGEEGKVKGGTIRQLYEVPALEEFADVIWHDEKRIRGE